MGRRKVTKLRFTDSAVGKVTAPGVANRKARRAACDIHQREGLVAQRRRSISLG